MHRACERLATACVGKAGSCQLSVAAERQSLRHSNFVSSLHIAEKRNFKLSFEWNIVRRKFYFILFRHLFGFPPLARAYILFHIGIFIDYWWRQVPLVARGAACNDINATASVRMCIETHNNTSTYMRIEQWASSWWVKRRAKILFIFHPLIANEVLTVDI